MFWLNLSGLHQAPLLSLQRCFVNSTIVISRRSFLGSNTAITKFSHKNIRASTIDHNHEYQAQASGEGCDKFATGRHNKGDKGHQQHYNCHQWTCHPSDWFGDKDRGWSEPQTKHVSGSEFMNLWKCFWNVGNTFIMIIVRLWIAGMLRTPWTSWRWRRWTGGIGKKPKTFFRFSLISNIINAIKIESPRDCNHWWRNDKKQFQSSDMYTWLVLVMGVFYAIPSLQVLINAI